MSTKIYTGFIVKHNDPALLMKQLKRLQTNYLQEALKCASSFFTEEELKKYWGSKEERLEVGKQIKLLYDEMIKASVVIYFFPGKILGTYFINNRELENKFRKQRWFQDYHYQNQSDPDETVNDKEWKQRKKDWDFLTIPAKDGFIFELILESDISPYYIELWKRKNAKI